MQQFVSRSETVTDPERDHLLISGTNTVRRRPDAKQQTLESFNFNRVMSNYLANLADLDTHGCEGLRDDFEVFPHLRRLVRWFGENLAISLGRLSDGLNWCDGRVVHQAVLVRLDRTFRSEGPKRPSRLLPHKALNFSNTLPSDIAALHLGIVFVERHLEQAEFFQELLYGRCREAATFAEKLLRNWL